MEWLSVLYDFFDPHVQSFLALFDGAIFLLLKISAEISRMYRVPGKVMILPMASAIGFLLQTFMEFNYINEFNEFFINDNDVRTPPSLLKTRYDFIVVGGGIAGCLLANRLSKKYNTLLIHGPGGVPNSALRVPALSIANIGDPDADWQYESEIYDTQNKVRGGRTIYNAGKLLGGSQVLSGHIWSIGKRADYKFWEEQFNITGFDKDTLVEYSKKHEYAMLDDNSLYNYGTHGEMALSHPPTERVFERYRKKWEEAGARVTGTKVLTDHNSDDLGFSKIVFAVNRTNGYLSTPVRSFIEPLLRRSENYVDNKLHVILKTMVKKILLEKKGSKVVAVGVDTGTRKFYATRKVILSAGAVRTPQLLMLSGIGPKSEIERIGLKTVVDRPGVGENVHDHYSFGVGMTCFPKGKGYEDLSMSSIIEYVRNRTGPMRIPYMLSTLGFLPSRNKEITSCPNPEDKDTCKPDFEVIIHRGGLNTQLGAMLLTANGLSDEDINEYFYLSNKDKPSGPFAFLDTRFNQLPCVSYSPVLLHPEARGRIVLKDAEITTKPIVDIKPTENARDMALLSELYYVLREISDKAFCRDGGVFTKPAFKNCEGMRDGSQEYGECVVRQFLKTLWHPGGSCRLGNEKDEMAVVDENFNVIGVSNLAIADGSLLPTPVSGHMLMTIAALAEKAADTILNDQTN